MVCGSFAVQFPCSFFSVQLPCSFLGVFFWCSYHALFFSVQFSCSSFFSAHLPRSFCVCVIVLRACEHLCDQASLVWICHIYVYVHACVDWCRVWRYYKSFAWLQKPKPTLTSSGSSQLAQDFSGSSARLTVSDVTVRRLFR